MKVLINKQFINTNPAVHPADLRVSLLDHSLESCIIY